MTYYLFASWEDQGPWAPQFGDHEKECVEYEAYEWRHTQEALTGIKPPVRHTRVVSFPRVPTERQAREKLATLPPPRA